MGRALGLFGQFIELTMQYTTEPKPKAIVHYSRIRGIERRDIDHKAIVYYQTPHGMYDEIGVSIGMYDDVAGWLKAITEGDE